jgi:biotin transport system ATP-binding protein
MPPAPKEPIVLTGACFAAGGKPILHDITLTLTEDRIGIVGRNGSGKSTLLRLIAGLVAPTSGQVRLGALDPAKDRKPLLSRLGILFQNPDHQILFPTVAEELAFGLRQLRHPDPAARVKTLLAAEGRSHWADAPTHTLSQGQRHYLCLLAVLLMEPQTILLDEPFAGLDLPTTTRLTRKLAALPQRLITISHDPAAVAAAERVIWLEAGRVVGDGPAAEVLAAFTTDMAMRGAHDVDTDLTP